MHSVWTVTEVKSTTPRLILHDQVITSTVYEVPSVCYTISCAFFGQADCALHPSIVTPLEPDTTHPMTKTPLEQV